MGLTIKLNKYENKCWVTEGYGCPYVVNGIAFDTYKCEMRHENSPCMKCKTKE